MLALTITSSFKDTLLCKKSFSVQLIFRNQMEFIAKIQFVFENTGHGLEEFNNLDNRFPSNTFESIFYKKTNICDRLCIKNRFLNLLSLLLHQNFRKKRRQFNSRD